MSESRESVVIYRSFHEASKLLSPEEYKELWVNLFDYSLDGDIPEFESALAEVIFTMAQPQIDANKKRQENGRKGGAPKDNQNARKQPLVNLENNHRLNEKQPNDNVNDNDNDNKKRNIKEKKPTPVKHIYGEYKHVKLTEAEYIRLGVDFGELKRAQAIKRLDEYIQEKPTYKSQDHNLAIRRWVLKALEEDAAKDRPPAAKTTFGNFECKHNYDYDEMEAKLLGQ